MPVWVYVLVRLDLDRSHQAVQACHAAMEAAKRFTLRLREPPNVVLCGVANEKELQEAVLAMAAAGIRFRAYAEPDFGDALTAVATEPIRQERRKVFRKFKLLRL